MNTIEKVGETSLNSKGTVMKIVQCCPSLPGEIKRVIVEFQDEHHHQVEATYANFKNGKVKNPYDTSVCDVGYLGVGKFVAKRNGILTEPYIEWRNLLCRCYFKQQSLKFPTYFGICTVCDEWLNFQNFAAWYERNKYNCNGRLHIDKDIIKPGNKIYSPKFCLLIPQRINMVFMTKKRTVDEDLPIGVRRSNLGKLYATYNGKHLGTFDTLEKAVDIYLLAKRKHIGEILNSYGDSIPSNVRNALANW